MILNFNVNQQTIVLMKTSSVPRIGSKEYLALQFSFSSDWENLEKLVYLQKGDVSQPISIVDNLVEVPEWFTEQDSFNVTLFGTDGTTEVPTNVVSVQLEKSNELWQKDAPEPQPSWLVTVLESVEKAKASEEAAKLSETNAANSANSAQESAASASASALNASSSATVAAQSETASKASETAAAESATVAQSAQSGAEAAQAAAAKSAQDAADVAATIGALPEDVNQLKQDVAAITPDDTVVNGKPWTSKHIVDTLCQPIDETGNPVQCYPVENYPLGVKVQIEPKQAGSGDPSPDNIRPITGMDTVRLTRCGKNLFYLGTGYEGQWEAKHTSVVDNFSINDDRISFKCAMYAISFAIRTNAIKAQSNMYMSFDADVDGAVGTIEKRILIRCFDKNGNIIADKSAVENSNEYNTYYAANAIQTNASVIRLRDDVSYVYAGIAVSCTDQADANKIVTVSNLQLEYGSAQTAYEPYRGNTYDIALPETVYGGTLDVETGVLTVGMAIITLDGTEEWGNDTTNSPGKVGFTLQVPGIATPTKPTIKGDIICNQYPTVTANNTYECTNGISVEAQGHTYFRIYSDTYAGGTIDEWKSYLSAQYAAGTPVQVCYKLAEPYTIQLTPQQITALSGVNTIYTDANGVIVTGAEDPKHTITELKNAIISIGGNI